MTGSLKKCKDCGHTTRKRTVGTPNGSCPARDHLQAQHRYYVVE